MAGNGAIRYRGEDLAYRIGRTLRVLARAMLARRFGLTVHDDRQPITVFALTAVKPKLRDADPSARSTCKRGIEDGNVAFACRNVTMAQFAERISQTAPGYLDHPVVDLTGLEKELRFRPDVCAAGPDREPRAGPRGRRRRERFGARVGRSFARPHAVRSGGAPTRAQAGYKESADAGDCDRSCGTEADRELTQQISTLRDLKDTGIVKDTR